MPVIYLPKKPNWSLRVYGDDFTPEDLHYLRLRNDKARFVIDTMTDDAFRNGFICKNPDQQPAERGFRPIVKRNEKFARQFGWGLMLHLKEGENNLANKIGEAQSAEIQSFGPFVAGTGGVTEWDTISLSYKKTGVPEWYKIKPDDAGSDIITANADRVEIYTNGDETYGWQGYTALGPILDAILSTHMWSAVAMRRARDYAVIRYLVQKLEGINQGEAVITAGDRDYIQKMMGDNPHAVVDGKWAINTVAPPMDPAETEGALKRAIQGIAIGSGNSVSDMEGSRGPGQDKGNGDYETTLRDIQENSFIHAKPTFARLGIEIKGMKSSWEIPALQKYELLSGMVDAFNKSPEGLDEVIAGVIQDIIQEQFEKKVVIDLQASRNAKKNASGGGEDPNQSANQGQDRAEQKEAGKEGGRPKWYQRGK